MILGNWNAEEFAKRLANIWIENFHLFAAVARFKRHDKTQSSNVEKDTSDPRSRGPAPTSSKVNFFPANISGAKSFASVVYGGEKKNSNDQPRGESRCVTMNDCDLIKVEESTTVALVKVQEVGTMNAVYRLCRSEGFTQIKPLALHSEAMKNVFSSIRNVSQNFVVDERMIWIEISGLPLCAWGSSAYKKVANVVGKFMFFEIDQGSSMGVGRVCIATKQKDLISENVMVTVNGENHMVRVQEIATWNIQIADDTVSEDATSEKDEEVGDIEEEVPSVDENVKEFADFEKEFKCTEENHIEVEKEKETSHLDDQHEGNASDASTDPSRPPGFEDFKCEENTDQPSGESSHTSKCSTMFAKYRKRNVRGISMIHEMSRLIDIRGALGYDVRGCRKTLKSILNGAGYNVHFLGIQESKLTRLELFRLKSMSGNYSFDYACSLARGRSGGITSIWDPAMFIKTNIWCDDHFVIVPDLNEVRDEFERYSSTFSRSEADCFNSFIEVTNLVEMPMGGRRFTWMNKSGTKMSKLDRFILSESILNETQDLKATVLERGKSDHNPIFLHVEKSDYGPYPFKFFHSWLKWPDFDPLIKKIIEDSSTITTTPGSRLKNRLKMLKEKIKEWHHSTKHIEQSQDLARRNRINEIDQKLDRNVASDSDREERLNLIQECEELDHITAKLSTKTSNTNQNKHESSNMTQISSVPPKLKYLKFVHNSQPSHKQTTPNHSLIKVQIRVQDDSSSATLSLFGQDVCKLIDKSQAYLMQKIDKDLPVETYPEDFDTMVGKKCVFKIQVSNYNLNNNYHVFTVNKLTKDESIIKELTKKHLGEEIYSEDEDVGSVEEEQVENPLPVDEDDVEPPSLTGSKRKAKTLPKRGGKKTAKTDQDDN
ncbi:RNA-directed DNA polymerase, eukaryota, Reverse transcriptase zinc-binding domain protein [Artemisia annua]|uniref:RNA-directed DNA polymerase, eukaryota, Reverse transcriptase zinc-binding domain protein n=1 Tax=Artemisia annua TaxID=35608 RepID=A0A2U1N1M2_ARTAN|nr:RNA-directed DNA polymerase, eukaryota, Reverse transcriptase zinc-binding domain protein [Artemisia annua]